MEKLVKYLLCFVLLISASFENCILWAQSDFVLSGSNLKIVISADSKVVIDNLNFKNEANATWWGGAGEMIFQGNQAVSVGGSFGSRYRNLTINKPNTTLTLNAPVVVTQELIMVEGNIATTSTNLLTIGTAPTSTGIITWEGGTVVGPLKRYFSGTASASQASGIFPVGLSGVNRYAQINYTSGLSTGGSLIAEYKAGICPLGDLGLPVVVNNQMIQNQEFGGYWEIAPTGGDLNTATYSLILRGNNLSSVIDVANITQLRILKSVSHTTWDNNGLGLHSTPEGVTTDFTISNTGMTGFSWFNVGSGNANPLPVTMLEFAANCNEKSQVDVKWTTASEQNANTFIIERSRDLVEWEYVTEVAAAGNSNYNINYQAIDANPIGGTSYYRLLQIDFNGAKEIYGPISVSCANEGESMIVFPNPTNASFTVEINSTESISQTILNISDLSGKTIKSNLIDINQGKNQFYFDDLDLQFGTYIIYILNSQNQIKPVKIIIN
jgi:hypothetical protein